MTSVERYLRLALYYGFLRYLPNENVPLGSLFMKARYYCCKPLFAGCGYPVNIRGGAQFGKGEMLRIGSTSDLGTNCRVVGPVTIGDNVGMSFDIFITAMNREFSRTDRTILADGDRPYKPVTIHDDVLILARVLILAGVTVGSHSVIGGGSVVSKDVPEWCVVVGNPARIVKWRKEPDPNYNPATMTPLSDKLMKKWVAEGRPLPE